MPIKIGINGFGRIGRLTFRFAWEMPEVEIVHVNEIIGGSETAAYLVKYDSVHGTWDKEVEATSADAFTVNGKAVSFSDHKDLTQAPWKSKGVELVIDWRRGRRVHRHLLLLRTGPRIREESTGLAVGLIHLLVVDPVSESLLAGHQAISHALVQPAIRVREHNCAAKRLTVLV